MSLSSKHDTAMTTLSLGGLWFANMQLYPRGGDSHTPYLIDAAVTALTRVWILVLRRGGVATHSSIMLLVVGRTPREDQNNILPKMNYISAKLSLNSLDAAAKDECTVLS